MVNWRGQGDSRPGVSKSKITSLDGTGPPKKVSYNPTGSESFGDRRGGTSSNWKGQKDSRP